MFKFKSEDKTIEETLFGVNNLRVPQFQRPYTWEEDQCGDFWNDLTDDDSFFLGQFILNFENKESEKFVDIVDGQQRTTSILILCAVFRDKLKELGFGQGSEVIQDSVMVSRKNFDGPPIFKIVVSPNIKDFFEKYIQGNDSKIEDNTVVENYEEKRVKKNYLFFKNQLDEYLSNLGNPNDQKGEIQRIYKFLLDTRIIVTEIYDENDAYEIFESVNNTGVELGVADLLKNFLFKKIKIEESGSVSEIMEKWTEILEFVPSSELTKFIRYYWLSKQKVFVTEAKLFKAIKNYSISSGRIFLQELVDNAKIYSDLRNPFDADFQNVENVEKLRNSLVGIREMNITQCYVLLLSIYRNKDKIKTNWIRVFELIEKFNFIYHAVSKLPANKVEKLYQELAFKIEDVVNKNIDEDSLRVILETDFNNLTNKLKSLLPMKDAFVLGFSDLTYKKKSLCRYVLSKIEESFGTSEYVLNQSAITIEHILPQRPGKDWNLTANQIKNYVHDIGNLTLLGRKPNGTVQNKSIAEKITLLKGSTEIKMTQKLLSQIEPVGVWNKDSIKNRSAELAAIAFDKVWKI